MSETPAVPRAGQTSVMSLEELAEMLPQYKFIGFLAEGGMGAVYLARQVTLNRKVAIKILPRDLSCRQFARHYEVEAQALAQLSHPGIVAIHDFGVTRVGDVYLVMEYVEGKTLHRLIRERAVSETQARDLALQLCDAMQHAHQQGILHRDLKPQNIMVGESGIAKVMDFGLARPAAAATEPLPLGTPGYAAPELSVPDALVDHRADIYALGVVCHEMLTGSRVDPQRLPLSAYGEFAAGWEEVIFKAAAIVPDDRYHSVLELGEAIKLIGTVQPPVQRDRSLRRSSPQPGASGAWPHWLSATLVLVFSLALVFWWPGRHGDARETSGDNISRGDSGSNQLENTAQAAESVKPFLPQGGPPGLMFSIDDAHRALIRDLYMMPDHASVVSCSEDGTVVVWDLRTRTQKCRLSADDTRFLQVTASRDGAFIAAASHDGRVYVWSAKDAGMPLAEVQFPGGPVPQMAFSPDGLGLLVATRHPAQPLVFWSWQDGRRQVLEGWDHGVVSLAFLEGRNDGAFLTLGVGADGSGTATEVRLGILAERRMMQFLPPIKAPPNRLHLSADGATAAIVEADRMTVVDIPSGAQVSVTYKPPDLAAGGAFVHGGQLLLGCSGEGRLQLTEVLTGVGVWTGRKETEGGASAMAVSRDGRCAVTGGITSPHALGRFPLHVWRLPPLSDLHSPEARAIGARVDLLNLASSDTQLSRLISSSAATWDEKVTRAAALALRDVDQQYIMALRREMSLSDATTKHAYAGEISRTSRGDEPPLYAVQGWPEPLKPLFKLYKERRAALPAEAAADWARMASEQGTLFGSLRQQRTAAGDAAGAARVALLQECLSSIKGEMVWEKLQTAIRQPVPPAALSRAVAWVARKHEAEPVGPAIAPVQGTALLRRPAQGGRLVAWKREGCLGPTECILSDQLPQVNDVVAVSAGTNHALAVRADGTVLAWGMRTDSEAAMVPAGLDHVVAVSAGLRCDLALREDGSVVAWSPRVLYLVSPSMKPAVSIHNGVTWGCARHADGSLTRLPAGDAVPLDTGPLGSLGLLDQVAVGYSLVLGLNREGKLIVQGNSRGASAPVSMVQKGQGDLLSVACNHHEGAVLSRDGGLVVFGEAWRVAKLNGRSFPGADRVVRCWPAGAFAIHFPDDRWQLASAAPQSAGDVRIGDAARGCIDLAVGQFCVIGIRP